MKKKSKKPLLSVIIPVFNEKDSIVAVLKAVHESGVAPLEVIVIDDGSTDGTREILQANKKLIAKLHLKDKNEGKGSALKLGIKEALGEMIIIQDADLEYDPADYKQLVSPILSGRADVVYGSRFKGSQPHRVAYFWHYIGNIVLTMLSNMTTNLNLSDMETGYKVFTRELLQSIELSESDFRFEPEVTAKVAARKARIYEVGISYHGRTYEEGKKIQVSDFFKAVWTIAKYAVLVRVS